MVFFFQETKSFSTNQLKVIVRLFQIHKTENVMEVLENEIFKREEQHGECRGKNFETSGMHVLISRSSLRH